jgi:RNA polymerase sigma factor (sigma-70 family)
VEASALSAPQAHRLRISLSAPLLRLRSDDQLVALFRAGNEDAFRTIHDRYRTRLYAYVRQMLGGSGSDAEDALQDVFLRAYGALRANGNHLALRPWLYRVAHNRCIDQLRRPTPHAADVYDVSRTPGDDPLAAAERRENLRRLVEDVRRLPEQQRSVLLMREMEGLSYAELAAALDVSVPAIKSLLVRARMGLVQAAEARDAACVEVRRDLAAAHGRGVRANGRARRHLRDCAACRDYRAVMRSRQQALAALTPVAGIGPISVLVKLIGGGGAAGGAAGGSAVAGGGAVVSGSAAAASAAKLALVVGAAVVTAGGAVEVRSELGATTHVKARPVHAAAAAAPRAAMTRTVQAPARVTAPTRPAADAHAEPATATLSTTRRHHRDHARAKADRLDARPDVVAPGPVDTPQAIPLAPAAPPATATAPVTGDRSVEGAMDGIAKSLPPTPAVTGNGAQGTTTPASTTQGTGSASSPTTTTSAGAAPSPPAASDAGAGTGGGSTPAGPDATGPGGGAG